MPTLQNKYIEKFYSLKDNLSETPNKFRRFGNKKTYYAPHVLLKKGLNKNEICASFVDFDCAFRDGCYGIQAPLNEVDKLKFLTVYFNSSLVSYFLFLSISSLGIEREQIMLEEYLQLPNIFEKTSISKMSQINDLFDSIIELKKDLIPNKSSIFYELKSKLDSLILASLNLTKIDAILIDCLLNSELSSFINKQKSIAYHPCQLDDTIKYAKYLNKTINEFLDYDDELVAWSTVFELSHRIPLNVTVLNLNNQKAADTVVNLSEQEIGQILKAMERHTYKKFAESIYFRRFFRYYDDDKIYIIKPNEKRFWSRSIAINDADELIVEMLNQMK